MAAHYYGHHESPRQRAKLAVPQALPFTFVGQIDEHGRLTGWLIPPWSRELNGMPADRQARELAAARARVAAAWRAGELPAAAWVTATSINAAPWPSSAWLRRRLFDCPSVAIRLAA
jgi:hypothetical protein